VSGKKKLVDSSIPAEINNNFAVRQGRSSFNGNNSMAGLINGRSVSQCFTSSMEPTNATNMSAEAIQRVNAKHDPVTEMIGGGSQTLVKSVDEGVFSQLKAAAAHSQGTNHNTIEHASNPFSQSTLTQGQNLNNHQRSSTITSNHNRRSQGNNRNNFVAQTNSMESNNGSSLNANTNPHTSIVVRNQINIINNGTSSSGQPAPGPAQQNQNATSMPISGGQRSKVNTRQRSQPAAQKIAGTATQNSKQTTAASQDFYSMGNQASAAANLMNLYSSQNVFDDLNQSKGSSKRFHNNNMVKAQQQNHTRKPSQNPANGKVNGSALISQSLVNGSKNIDDRANRAQGSRSLQARSNNPNTNAGPTNQGQIYTNASQSEPFSNTKYQQAAKSSSLRPSSALR
jgi:hypothetical protein